MHEPIQRLPATLRFGMGDRAMKGLHDESGEFVALGSARQFASLHGSFQDIGDALADLPEHLDEAVPNLFAMGTGFDAEIDQDTAILQAVFFEKTDGRDNESLEALQGLEGLIAQGESASFAAAGEIEFEDFEPERLFGSEVASEGTRRYSSSLGDLPNSRSGIAALVNKTKALGEHFLAAGNFRHVFVNLAVSVVAVKRAYVPKADRLNRSTKRNSVVSDCTRPTLSGLSGN
jgi:hypothetical protein